MLDFFGDLAQYSHFCPVCLCLFIVLIALYNVKKTQNNPTIKPGYGNSFEEDKEEKTHPTSRVVIKQLEHVQATLG